MCPGLLPEGTPLLDHMLHVCAFRCVQFDVILGQDLHYRPDFQPPLHLWDAMPAADDRGSVTFYAHRCSPVYKNNTHLTQNLCLPLGQREAGM